MAWLTGWNRRKSKIINGSTAGAQVDYQMKITVHKDTGADTATDIYLGANVRDDFGDVRFTKSDGSSLLNYWIESYVSGSAATIWIQVDSIPISPGTATIYVYYDNSSQATTSGGVNTFRFFDDFNRVDGAIGDGWVQAGGSVTISGNKTLLRTTGADAWAYNPAQGDVNGIVITEDFQVIYSSSYAASFVRSSAAGNWYNDSYGWIYFSSQALDLYDSGTTKASVSLALSPLTWYVAEMIIAPDNSTQIRIWQKGTARPSAATLTYGAFTPTSAGTRIKIAGAGNYNTDQSYVDNYYIRKYVSPEPTFGTTGTEESVVCNVPSCNLIILEILSEQLSRTYPEYIDLEIVSKFLDDFKHMI